MRVLQSRKKLDAYQIMYHRLYLQDTDIHLDDPNMDKLEAYQKFARMALANPDLEEFGVKTTEDYESLFSAAETGKDFNNFRLGAIDVKVCCLSFGFYRPSDRDAYIPYEDRKYYYVKVPLSGTGKIFVGTMDRNDERYIVNWLDGYVLGIKENINGYYTSYANLIRKNQHVVDAELSAFLVTEYTPK